MRKHHTSIYSDLRQPLQIAVAAVAAMCGGTFPLVGSPKRVCVPTTNTNTQPVGLFDTKKSHKMSMARANLNNSKELVTNATAASKFGY